MNDQDQDRIDPVWDELPENTVVVSDVEVELFLASGVLVTPRATIVRRDVVDEFRWFLKDRERRKPKGFVYSQEHADEQAD